MLHRLAVGGVYLRPGVDGRPVLFAGHRVILGHMQRGGSPTCRDRVYGSMMGAYAADLLAEGKGNRVVAYHHGEYVDYDIQEALEMQKELPDYMVRVSKALAI